MRIDTHLSTFSLKLTLEPLWELDVCVVFVFRRSDTVGLKIKLHTFQFSSNSDVFRISRLRNVPQENEDRITNCYIR